MNIQGQTKELLQNGCTNNGNICVEESIDCREAGSRFFRLTNHESGLSIILSKDSDFMSCKLAGGHEIVVDKRLYTQNHATWAIGDRPYQKLSSLPWNCHVRNPELHLSTSNNSSSIVYELTRLNELNCLVKLKSIHLQHQATYFNLNNAKEKSSINGHTLVVQSTSGTSKIQAQSTKLLCQCNKSSSILPQSLIGDIPFELVQHDASMCTTTDGQTRPQPPPTNRKAANNRQPDVGPQHQDDIIVCDSVYSLESTSPMDMLSVKLQFNERSLTFELRPASYSSVPVVGKGSASRGVSMYDAGGQVTSRDDDHQKPSSSTTSESSCRSSADPEHRPPCWLGSLIESAPSSEPPLAKESSEAIASSTSQQPIIVLKVRVRVTNFGVCIMPLMMNNYICKYRFLW